MEPTETQSEPQESCRALDLRIFGQILKNPLGFARGQWVRLSRDFSSDEFPEVGWDEEMHEIVGVAGEISHFEMLGATPSAYVNYTGDDYHDSWWCPLSLLVPA